MRWHDGDLLKIDAVRKRSFIFIDFESPPTSQALKLIVKSLQNWRSDWYLLDSGGSFHLIIDKLVRPTELPLHYGQLIMDVAFNLPPNRAKFWGHIGLSLIQSAGNSEKISRWKQNTYSGVGHIENSITDGLPVFPIDLKYICHSLNPVANLGLYDEGFLRVSSRHGSVPILKALQDKGQVYIFKYPHDPFGRQPELPLGI